MLHAAAVGENEAIVSLLLERGFDPKVRDGGGQTQLEGIDQELELKLRRDGMGRRFPSRVPRGGLFHVSKDNVK
jgi:hypothetical protein